MPGGKKVPGNQVPACYAGLVTPLQAATVAEAAITPGSALSFAYQRKVRGAAEDCLREGIAFLPLVVESLEAGTRPLRQK